MKKLERELFLQMSRECLSFNVKRAERIIGRRYNEKTSRLGLRPTQIHLLYNIGFWEPVSINKIADTTNLDRTTVIRNSKILEKNGLITIEVGKDRRYKIIRLTREGWDIINEAYALWRDQQREFAMKMGKDKMDELLKMLKFTARIMKS